MGADAPELSYAQPLFLEEQRAAQVLGGFVNTMWTIAAVQFLGCMIAVALLYHRIHHALIGLILGAGVLVFGIVMLCVNFVGITVLESAELQIRLTGFGLTVWKRTIRLTEILSAELTPFRENRSVLQLMQGDVNFMTNKQCVRLRLKNHRNILIGSQRPQELLEAVRATLAAARLVDPVFIPNMDRGHGNDA
jgi:hypothetical protein